MKKLLLVLVLVMSFFLISCDNTETEVITTYDYSEDIDALDSDIDALALELEEQIDLMQEQVDALQERLDNIVVTEGLNGRRSYYENKILTLNNSIQLATEKLYDLYYDSEDAPAYTLDSNGNYINAVKLGNMLRYKYFGDLEEMDNYDSEIYMLDKFYIYLPLDNETLDLDTGDIIARMILLTEEMKKYESYIINCTYFEIDMIVSTDGMGCLYNLRINSAAMLNDYFSVEIGSILDGGYEMYLNVNVGDGLNVFSQDEVYAYYNNYILNGTYDGYVLNYTE